MLSLVGQTWRPLVEIVARNSDCDVLIGRGYSGDWQPDTLRPRHPRGVLTPMRGEPVAHTDIMFSRRIPPSTSAPPPKSHYYPGFSLTEDGVCLRARDSPYALCHDGLSKTILQATFEGGRRRGRQRKTNAGWTASKIGHPCPRQKLLTRAS